MFNPKKMYKGAAGYTLTATMIQKMYRYYRAHTNFKQLKFLMAKATYIQRKFRLYQIKSKAKKKIQNLNNDKKKAWD